MHQRYKAKAAHLGATEDLGLTELCEATAGAVAAYHQMTERRASSTPGGAMRWSDRIVIEAAQTCREALGSWHRTGQLCALILAISLGLALMLWVTHS